MDIRKLQRAIVDGLEGVKAQNIVVYNTEAQSPLFERVIVASGASNRQTKALAASVRDTVKERGFPVLATEGEDNGEWIIVDCGAAVAHIMQPTVRDYYRLEEIWGGKPVHLKMTAPAAASKPTTSKPTTSKSTASKPTASMPTAARSSASAAKKAAPAAKKVVAAAKKAAAPAKKAVPARPASTVSRKAAGKPATRKAPAARSA